jgi:hypothetical protein
MPNFVKTGATAPRLPGDFSLAPSAAYPPNAAELDYLTAISDALAQLAADDAADIAARYPENLFSGRQAARKAAMAALDADAANFVGGRNPTGDRTRLNAALADYTAGIPKYGAKDATEPRFEGDFDTVVALGYLPGPDEQLLLDNIEAAKAEMANDKRKDVSERLSPTAVKLRERLRQSVADSLRSQVEKFVATSASPKAAAEEAVLMRGRYQARRDRLERRLFNVSLKSEPKRPAEDDGTDLVLDINLLSGLPAPHDVPSPEKLALFVDINKALTVVRTVCERLDERSQRGLRGWLFGPNAALQRRARLLQAEFLEKLHGVAWIGLELEFTSMAKLTLEEIRREFFAREADRIKSIYTRRLGAWASATAALLLLAYIMIYTGKYPSPWAFDHKSFLLAASGAAIGAWTSFSARQVQFSFDDLIMVDEGTYDPPMRILFVIVLTMAACLLFWNGAINLEIGNLKTQAEPFRQSGSVALLIGLFCGLSERALATAIAGRAAAFVKGISSGA